MENECQVITKPHMENSSRSSFFFLRDTANILVFLHQP